MWRGPNPAREVDRRKVPRRVYDFLRPHEVAPVLASAQGLLEKWLGPESNREPADYETAALTD